MAGSDSDMREKLTRFCQGLSLQFEYTIDSIYDPELNMIICRCEALNQQHQSESSLQRDSWRNGLKGKFQSVLISGLIGESIYKKQ
jgi:hypothetical protein